MKRIKPYVLMLLVVMTVLCLSACGRNDNAGTGGNTGTTSGAESSSAMESSSGMESTSAMGTNSMDDSRAADEASEGSTGVIDGMIDDVEKGVDDITGESGGRETAAGESTSAAR